MKKYIFSTVIICVFIIAYVLFDYSNYIYRRDPVFREVCVRLVDGHRYPITNYINTENLPVHINHQVLKDTNPNYIWTIASNLEDSLRYQIYAYITYNRALSEQELFELYLNSLEIDQYGCGLTDISINKYGKPYSELTEDEFAEIVDLIKNQSV